MIKTMISELACFCVSVCVCVAYIPFVWGMGKICYVDAMLLWINAFNYFYNFFHCGLLVSVYFYCSEISFYISFCIRFLYLAEGVCSVKDIALVLYCTVLLLDQIVFSEDLFRRLHFIHSSAEYNALTMSVVWHRASQRDSKNVFIRVVSTCWTRPCRPSAWPPGATCCFPKRCDLDLLGMQTKWAV